MMLRSRGEWLANAVRLLDEQIFVPAGLEVPKVKVTVGFLTNRGPKSTVIGECWPAGSTPAQVPFICIHPSLTIRTELLAVLVHEMVHAIDNCESGHRGAFSAIFRQVGLRGRRTESDPSPELLVKLRRISGALGPYPNSVEQ
jgi:hypothetical protein